MNEERLAETLGLVYDAALDQAAWPALLAGLARLFNAHFADSFYRSTDYSSFGGIAVGLDAADYQDEFLGLWVKRNVWGKRRPVRRSGDVLTTREMMTHAELIGSEMYNDYLASRGLQEGLRLDIRATDSLVEDISILRPWSAGAYDQTEIRAARMLLPHLQRASAMARRLSEAQSLAGAGLAALDGLPTVILLLDRQQRLLHANRAGQALLGEADGLVAGPGGLLAAAAGRELDAVLGRAVGTAGRPAASGMLRLPRPSGAPALILLSMPIRPEPGRFGLSRSGVPAAIVCIADPRQRPSLRQAELRALFGLTSAEAALATDLLAGDELRTIAARSGRTVNTLRSLLARLMAKTDTHRQSELVRLLGGLSISD